MNRYQATANHSHQTRTLRSCFPQRFTCRPGFQFTSRSMQRVRVMERSSPAPELGRDEALRRLRARAAEWSTTDCEEICSHEIGDTITELLTVMGLAGQDNPGEEGSRR